MEVINPKVGKTIIIILQFGFTESQDNKKFMLPFPLTYNRSPPTKFFRKALNKLRKQIRVNCKGSQPAHYGYNMIGKGLNKTTNDGELFLTGDKPEGDASSFLMIQDQSSTQNSHSERNQEMMNEIRTENIMLKTEVFKLRNDNKMLKKIPGAVEYDNLLSQKSK